MVDTDAERPDTDYASKIQLFNRFALEEISTEGNAFPNNPHIVRPADGSPITGHAAAPITQLLGIDSTTVIVCQNCGAKRNKEGMAHVVDLLYPRKVHRLMSNIHSRIRGAYRGFDFNFRHSRMNRPFRRILTLLLSWDYLYFAIRHTKRRARAANS